MTFPYFFLLGCVLLHNTLDAATAFRVATASSPAAARRSVVVLEASPLTEDALAACPYEFLPDDADTSGKRFFMDITKQQASAAFEELATLYGDESALQMVKIQPLALSRNPNNFEPTLAVWTETFGEEAAKSMVRRNPGLLLLSPQSAASDAMGTMGWSFVIWATRPILSKLLLAGLIFYQYNAVRTSEEGIPQWILNSGEQNPFS
ncbi:expressed unknown protein [Seminavis robusta]|uniref:Uncharacterized protein n=1 Tax=Seminavis robusta TaxID=568900 RepID=A0A9N8HAD9_9STRA|nr:expressed unknown protein [Seminavis robusta]|eukprot:Sro144_g067120.1 n/a (207) ;mRNA; f:92031-92651